MGGLLKQVWIILEFQFSEGAIWYCATKIFQNNCICWCNNPVTVKSKGYV